MPIEFACACGKAFKVADEYAGKRSKCTACGQPVVVPQPVPADDPTDEDAAVRALLDGDDPEPAPRTGGYGGYAGAAPPRTEPPPPPRQDAGSHAARALAASSFTEKAAKPQAKKAKAPSYGSSYDAPPERRWSPNWLKVGGGALAILGAVVWFGLGWLAGRIYFYPIFLVLAGLFGIINGLFSRSGD